MAHRVRIGMMARVPNAVPQHCPTPRELDDLELLATGALAPTSAFNEPGSPVTLTLPADLADAPERSSWSTPRGCRWRWCPRPATRRRHLGVKPLTHAQYGPFRRLYLTPEQVREQYAGRAFVPVAEPLTEVQLDRLPRRRPAGPAGPGRRRARPRVSPSG